MQIYLLIQTGLLNVNVGFIILIYLVFAVVKQYQFL